MIFLCFFKKRTAYEMRIGDWSSDVCSSDLHFLVAPSKPLGLVAADEACSVVPIDVPLPDGILPEVRIHREIYRARPDMGGIRSEERRVGKETVSKCSFSGSRYTTNKQLKK